MSLLPGQIIPQTVPIGSVDPKTGDVALDKNWWLFFYNLALNTLGTGGGLPQDDLIALLDNEIDATGTDAAALRLPIESLAILVGEPLLQDRPPQAPPAQSITVTASPFTFTALFDGVVTMIDGAVTSVAIIRQGVSFDTGMQAGIFNLSRLDKLRVTYSSAPTMNFLAR